MVKAKGLPKKIRVAAFDIRIEVEDLAWSYKNARWGEFSSIEQRISLQCDFPNVGKLLDTVMHEISHAIFFAYGIEDSDAEERTVGALGTAWAQIWLDNPALLEWLNQTVKSHDARRD